MWHGAAREEVLSHPVRLVLGLEMVRMMIVREDVHKQCAANAQPLRQLGK